MWLLGILPVRVVYGILYPVIVFYLLFAPKGRRAIYRYFRERFDYPVCKAACATYRNHYLFGQTLVDKFAVFAGKGERFTVEYSGLEHFQAAVNSEKSCIIASSHIGNFEIAGYLLKEEKKRINGIVFAGEAEMMQKYRSSVLERQRVNLIPVWEDMSHIFEIHRALGNGEIVSMPCDRFFSGNKSGKFRLLGKEATFPTGAFHLAEHFGAEVLAFFVMKVKGARYRIHICPVTIPDEVEGRNKRITLRTERFVGILEEMLKRYPEQWFNFYDFWNGTN